MLNNIGLPGLLLIAGVTLVLFGRGKVSSLMGELGSGISAFKKGIRDGDRDDAVETPARAPKTQTEPGK
ncbi:MAG: twin-arginine translocase TatA/TatE family subunit [Paracoccaceae bacterium]|nr:twin-arginine translocase TatA/TatE family subunit [Maritimibacter sp.]